MATGTMRKPSRAELSEQCRQQLADLRRLAHSMSDDDWAAPSLLPGWTCKDVFAHLLGGRLIGIGKAAVGIARYKGDMDAWAAQMSISLAKSLTVDEMLESFDRETSRWPERGISGKEPPAAKLADNTVHELDIRFALGRFEEKPADRMADTLNASFMTNMWGNKKRTTGLRFVATDVDWSAGDDGDPVVQGPAQHLLLAINGRPAGLDGLTGEGVETLRSRLA